MPEAHYLRPREKMSARSARSLSDNELIQLLIGTGTKRHPLNRLARRVLRSITKSGGIPDMGELVALPGLGTVKAARIVSAFELARRLNRRGARTSHLMNDLLTQKSTNGAFLLCALSDGAKHPIGLVSVPATLPLHSVTATTFYRSVIATQGVESVSLGLKGNFAVAEGAELCRELYRGLRLLGIQLTDFRIKSGTEERVLYSHVG